MLSKRTIIILQQYLEVLESVRNQLITNRQVPSRYFLPVLLTVSRDLTDDIVAETDELSSFSRNYRRGERGIPDRQTADRRDKSHSVLA